MLFQTLFGSRLKSKPDDGFTLIELIVVIVIIGIIAALLGPTWLTFVKVRRMNAVNDAIFQAVEQAKNRAQKEKVSYSVGFRTINGVPQIAVYPASLNVPVGGSTFSAEEQKQMDAAWAANAIDQGAGLRSKDVVIATNLVGENDVETAGSYEFDAGQKVSSIPETTVTNAPPVIRLTFDLTGTIRNTPESTNMNDPESGAVLIAAMPANPGQVDKIEKTTAIQTSQVRCVWSSTLLGGLEVGRNKTDCAKFLKGGV